MSLILAFGEAILEGGYQILGKPLARRKPDFFLKHWPNRLLSGCWRGELTCSCQTSFANQVIYLRLMMIEHGHELEGFLYYSRECKKSNKILIRGLDEYREFTLKETNNFSVKFLNVFHEYPGKRSANKPLAESELSCSLCKGIIKVETVLKENSGPCSWTGHFKRA